MSQQIEQWRTWNELKKEKNLQKPLSNDHHEVARKYFIKFITDNKMLDVIIYSVIIY